jgi:AraC family transcriptional regulator
MHTMKRNDPASGLAEIAAHIRRNLDEPIDLRALAERAGFSPYHFHRIFRAVFGEPLAAYVRRERLQRAASALRTTGRDVTGIALEAGYDSPSAFARSFAEHFGIAPTKFRADDTRPIVPEHALPHFRSSEMTVHVEHVPALRLLSVRRIGAYAISAPSAFAALVAIASKNGLLENRTQFVALSHGNPESCDESDLRYDACFSSEGDPVDELEPIEHPGGRYAVYRHTGPYDFIEHVFDRLFDAVVLSGKFELRDAPCMEIYRNDPITTAPAELVADVCLPVH